MGKRKHFSEYNHRLKAELDIHEASFSISLPKENPMSLWDYFLRISNILEELKVRIGCFYCVSLQKLLGNFTKSMNNCWVFNAWKYAS